MRCIVFVFLLVFFVACSQGNKTEKNIPSDSVLSENQMKAVLFDMYLTESFIKQKEREGKNNIYYSEHYYGLMMNKHKIDTNMLVKSFNYYSSIPDVFKRINQSVLDSLIVLETETGPYTP